MFLLKRGLRYLLIQSQRDGRGSVRQRPVWRFQDAEDLRTHLEPSAWRSLQTRVRETFPEFSPDWEKVRERAEAAVAGAQAIRRVPKLLKAGQKLAACLEAERDTSVLRQAQRELTRLCARLDQRLRGAARAPQRLERAEKLADEGKLQKAERLLRKIDPQPESVELLAEVLERQDRGDEALEARAHRVKLRPNAKARLELGAALHRAGRLGEALEQYRQIPTRQPARYYNEGAAWLQAGKPEAALRPLLLGLARDQRIAWALIRGRDHDYWEHYGELWSTTARDFLLSLASDTHVRHSLNTLNRKGPRVRRPVPLHALGSLLNRVLTRPMRRLTIDPSEPKYGRCPVRPRRDRPRRMTVRRQSIMDKCPYYEVDPVLPPPDPPKRRHPRARKRLREERKSTRS